MVSAGIGVAPRSSSACQYLLDALFLSPGMVSSASNPPVAFSVQLPKSTGPSFFFGGGGSAGFSGGAGGGLYASSFLQATSSNAQTTTRRMAGLYSRRAVERAPRCGVPLGTPHRRDHVDRQLDALQLVGSQPGEASPRVVAALAGQDLHAALRRVLRRREEAARARRAARDAALVQVAELHDLGDRHLAARHRVLHGQDSAGRSGGSR